MGELFAPFHLLILFIIAVPILGIHFAPAIIAGVRHARNFWWILAVTFFFSWTIVGWIIALIWAIRDEPRDYAPPAQAQPYNL
jgi:predicted membrane protein